MPRNSGYKKIRDKLPFPKAPYQNFYNRILSWRYTVEQAAYPDKIVSDRRGEARKYYDAYQWNKPERKTFRSRISYWVAWEDAMSLERVSWKNVGETEPIKKVKLKKTYKWEKEKKFNPENYFIRVTMNTEEAKSYHRAYRSMIAELEDKIYNLEDTSILAELNKKLEFIKQQYQVFLSFNPI